MGVWIETRNKPVDAIQNYGRTLCGCVDWNEDWAEGYFSLDGVAPYVGVWIETPWTRQKTMHDIVAPYVGVWIETQKHNQI